jgi:hypothetical protein
MRRAALACLLLLAPVTAEAVCTTTPEECGYVAFILENDKPSGRDQYYTNGFQLSWSSRAYAPPAWLAPITGQARRFVQDENLRWGLSLGQKMFTPQDTRARNPDPRDRPYAGWLYGALTLISSGDTQLSSIELQIGVVGPASLAEFTQNGVHDVINTWRSRGWDTQIKDEPGVNLVLNRQYRQNWATGLDGLSVGIVPSVAASLGNVNTYLGGGLALRIGNALDADFGPPRVRPVSGGSVFYERPFGDGLGWYAFAGLEGRIVARDVTLDGNTWRDSRSVDREWLVGDASAGLALMYGGWRVTATYTARSREFAGQREMAKFGSLSLARQF